MNTREMAEVMLAFDRGEAVQRHRPSLADIWEDDPEPTWNWNGYTWRVKPTPKRIWVQELTHGAPLVMRYYAGDDAGPEWELYEQVVR